MENLPPNIVHEITPQESTDRCNLYVCKLTVHDFVDELVTKMRKVTSHHFIATTQIECLRDERKPVHLNMPSYIRFLKELFLPYPGCCSGF